VLLAAFLHGVCMTLEHLLLPLLLLLLLNS
jgi:hypothetical protein